MWLVETRAPAHYGRTWVVSSRAKCYLISIKSPTMLGMSAISLARQTQKSTRSQKVSYIKTN
jgi:hypothetical protein